MKDADKAAVNEMAKGLEAAAKALRDVAELPKASMADIGQVLAKVVAAAEGSIVNIVGDALAGREAGVPCDCSTCTYIRKEREASSN